MNTVSRQRSGGSTKTSDVGGTTAALTTSKASVRGQNMQAAFIPAGEVPAGGSFGVRGQNALVALRASQIDGTFKGEPEVAQGLHEAAVSALAQELAKIAAKPGNSKSESEALIFDALDDKKAKRVAKRLKLKNPLLDPVSTLGTALFDPRLAHVVGNLAIKNEFLLSKLFDSYLAELPRMQMEMNGKTIDVVPEEAINPLASAAVDWAYGRFDAKVTELIKERSFDELGNLLVLGHLFGKFDADPAREAHLDILAAHQVDAYPVFAKRLVANRMRYNTAFRRLGAGYRDFVQVQQRCSDEQDVLRRIKRKGAGPGPDAERLYTERLRQAESTAVVTEQGARTQLAALQARLAHTAMKCGGDSQSYDWRRASGAFDGGGNDAAAQEHLFRALRSVDIDAISSKELETLLNDKLLSNVRFRGFKKLADARLTGASAAEKIAVAVYTLLLKRADREDGLAVHQRDWMVDAVDRLLSKPPELDELKLQPLAPHFDEGRYAVRARRAFERLESTDGGAWLSNQSPKVDAELERRVEQIEEVLGPSEDIRKLLKSKSKIQASQTIAARLGQLSHIAAYGVGYVAGTTVIEDLSDPRVLALFLAGMLCWQMLAKQSHLKAGKKMDHIHAVADVDIKGSDFGSEIAKARDALVDSVKRWKHLLQKFLMVTLLSATIGLGLGVNEPRTSQAVDDALDAMGIEGRIGLPGFVESAEELLFQLREAVTGEDHGKEAEEEAREASLTNYGPDKEGAQDYQREGDPTGETKAEAKPRPEPSEGSSTTEGAKPNGDTEGASGEAQGGESAQQGAAASDGDSGKDGQQSSKAGEGGTPEEAGGSAKSDKQDGSSKEAAPNPNPGASESSDDAATSDSESKPKSESGAKSDAKSESNSGAKSDAKSESNSGAKSESDSGAQSKPKSGEPSESPSAASEKSERQSEASNSSEKTPSKKKTRRSKKRKSNDQSKATSSASGKDTSATEQKAQSDVNSEEAKKPEKTRKTRPVNANEAPDLRPPSIYTFRPDNYPVDFWVSSSGYLRDDGNYGWGMHRRPRTIEASRNFDTQADFMKAVDAEVAEGRMVAVSLDGSTMEYPVGSRLVELLTIGEGDATAIAEGIAGVRVSSGGAKVVAAVFEPYKDRKKVDTYYLGPEWGDNEGSDSEFYNDHPRVWQLQQHLKQRREVVGQQAAFFEVRDSLDQFVDPGLADFDSSHTTDESFVSELMRTQKTADGREEFVNDTWNIQQFTTFSHWLDREGGGSSVILAGRADTNQAGYGPGVAHQLLMYDFYNTEDDRGYRAIDVMPVTETPVASPSEPLDIAAMLKEDPIPVSTVIGYCLAGIVLLGGAGFGLRWLMNRKRAGAGAKQMEQLAEQLSQDLAQTDPAVAVGVLSTLQRASEYWLDPKADSRLADMNSEERLGSLRQTYLHEVGVELRPRSIDAEDSNTSLEKLVRQAATSKDGPRLAKLLSALYRSASTTDAKGLSPQQKDRFDAAQALLRKMIQVLPAPRRAAV